MSCLSQHAVQDVLVTEKYIALGCDQGIDSIPPMVEFAKSYPVLPADGIPCKMAIVNYFSRLMWLMMGSWTDLNRYGTNYITREEFLAAAKTKFDVDFVVDQVMRFSAMTSFGFCRSGHARFETSC